jgi:hypothetical protein
LTSATIYFDVYESATLTGTYTHKISYTTSQNSSGASFYSTGPISVNLEAGKFYYIGARWDPEQVTYYYNSSSGLSYPTDFGKWEMGMLNGVGTNPSTFTYNNTYIDYAYYQRLTTK